MGSFDHERLEVYRVARQFTRELRELLDGLPRGTGESQDNLLRAAKSVTRNIAEGAGRWSIPDKIRFYHIARASATECAASLDELIDLRHVEERAVTHPKDTLGRVAAMLTTMIRSMEHRAKHDDTR